MLRGIEVRDWSIIKQMVVEVHNASKKLPEVKAILKDKKLDINVEAGITDPMDNCNIYCRIKS